MKLSVIVPVYNAQATLKQCVQSILRQPYSDLELLLVNDASTDGSLELAHALERTDKRVTVYDKPHSGVGLTRNFGAQRAKGEYLFFVDADDWLGDDALAAVMQQVEREQPDLCVVDVVRENMTQGLWRVCGLPLACPTADVQANRQVFLQLVGPDRESSPWRNTEMLASTGRRLFRRAWFLTCGFAFPEEKQLLPEDLPVSLQAHCRSQKTLFLSVPLYHYRYTGDSLGARYRMHMFERYTACYEQVAAFLKGEGLYPALRVRHAAWYVCRAAHDAMVNVFDPGNPKDPLARREELRAILQTPALRRALTDTALRAYVSHGTCMDRLLWAVMSSRSLRLHYGVYWAHARRLRKGRSHW